MPQQPDFWKPALLSGAIFGFVSAVPFVGFLNCLCCSLILGSGMLTAYLMIRASTVAVGYGWAALGGAVSGAVAAVMWGLFNLVFSLLLQRDFSEEIRQAAEQANQVSPGAEEAARILEGLAAPVLMAIFTLMMMVIFTPFGAAGGLIGRALFERRTPPAPGTGEALGLDSAVR
jgi:hypothetical protein